MSAAQKAPYEKKATDAKKAYEKAMEEFKAQGGVAGGRRKEKAADKPKKPPSSYWLWLGENRAALVKEA